MILNHKFIQKSGLIYVDTESSAFGSAIICNRKNLLLLVIKHFWVLLFLIVSERAIAQAPLADFSGTPKPDVPP